MDLNSVVEAMRPLLSRVAGSFIRLEMALDPTGVWVAVDRDQLEQVVLQLVLRASNAMPLGGNLVISTRHWRLTRPHPHALGSIPAGRWNVLQVADSGAPLDGAALAELAAPSPRSIGAVAAGGAGLGRVAVNVRRAGGHVLIEHGATPGTAVGICLPAKDSMSGRQGVPENTPAVLVVDGDAWLRTTTAHLLRRGGYGVLQADHASTALEVLRGVTGSCVRVMLIDTDLPGNEAPTLVRDARKLRSDLQVVHVGRARAGSRDDLLTKPFTAAELLQAIGRRLGPAVAG